MHGVFLLSIDWLLLCIANALGAVLSLGPHATSNEFLEPWPLVIAGDGPLYASIARRISEQSLTEYIHLIGHQSYNELPTLYASAGALVFPSLSETWGLVVNEAMAAGLPVLVSENVGCHPDLIREGINGWTFNPTDVVQLAGLFNATANAECRHTMGEASREIIRAWDLDRFSGGIIESAAAAYSFRSQGKQHAAVAMAAALSCRAAMLRTHSGHFSQSK